MWSSVVVEIVAEVSSEFNKAALYIVESKDVQTGRAPAPKADSGLPEKCSFLSHSFSG
jgi:hypothetical protein